MENLGHSTFYAVEFTRFGKKFSAEVLILRGKMLFSVEKYVGNVDNFLLGQAVENQKNGKKATYHKFLNACANLQICIVRSLMEEKRKSKTGAAPGEVSSAVIKRLPRYFRYLRELIRNGKMRISSGELSKMMNVTASQIRQDLNCFGGFGQQGYGYNVNYLYAKICEILGVGEGFNAILIGAGNLGKALVRSPMFEKRGVDILALFDVDPTVFGRNVGDLRIYDMAELESFCATHRVDIAVLTLPKACVEDIAPRLCEIGIPGIWNFTGSESAAFSADTVIENVHIGDSLMTLCYELRSKELGEREENTGNEA